MLLNLTQYSLKRRRNGGQPVICGPIGTLEKVHGAPELILFYGTKRVV